MAEKHIADAESTWKVCNITPDMCIVNGQVVPFEIYQVLTPEKSNYASTVRARGCKVLKVNSINFDPPERARHRVHFDNLTPYYPTEKLSLEVEGQRDASTRIIEIVGEKTATELRAKTLDIYRRAAEHALARGIIIADTKFEFGWHDGQLILIDEVLTPDSSRFWPADGWSPGRAQPSFDKQFVRDWSVSTGWDKTPPGPEIPPEIVRATRERYIEVYERITGNKWDKGTTSV